MHPSLHYGEVVHLISDRIYQYEHFMQLDRTIDLNETQDETLFSLIGKSAHIFATVQDLFDDEPLIWMKAAERYADHIIDTLLMGHRPKTIDFLNMVTQSIQAIH